MLDDSGLGWQRLLFHRGAGERFVAKAGATCLVVAGLVLVGMTGGREGNSGGPTAMSSWPKLGLGEERRNCFCSAEKALNAIAVNCTLPVEQHDADNNESGCGPAAAADILFQDIFR